MQALALIPRSALAADCASCLSRRCALLKGSGSTSCCALLRGPDATCIACAKASDQGFSPVGKLMAEAISAASVC